MKTYRDPHLAHADARDGIRRDAQNTAVKTACLAVDDPKWDIE